MKSKLLAKSIAEEIRHKNAIEAICDELLQNSIFKDFPAEDSEIEGNVCKYFDGFGNAIAVDSVTGVIQRIITEIKENPHND